MIGCHSYFSTPINSVFGEVEKVTQLMVVFTFDINQLRASLASQTNIASPAFPSSIANLQLYYW
jgi:hypothetical protein